MSGGVKGLCPKIDKSHSDSAKSAILSKLIADFLSKKTLSFEYLVPYIKSYIGGVASIWKELPKD